MSLHPITAPDRPAGRAGRTRGFTLIECLVALLLLSLGLIGAAALQATLAKGSAKSDVRLRAVTLAAQLHSRMMGDYVNLTCYQYSAGTYGTCTSASAAQAASAWVAEARALPGSLDPSVTQAAGIWTVVVNWQMAQDTTGNSHGAGLVNHYSMAFKVDTTP